MGRITACLRCLGSISLVAVTNAFVALQLLQLQENVLLKLIFLDLNQRACQIPRVIIFLTDVLHVPLLPFAESFGDEERGIRKFTRVEASEREEGQRTVLGMFLIRDGVRCG